MRWLVAILLVCLGLSGCAEVAEPAEQPSSITLRQAIDVLRGEVGDAVVTKALMVHDFDGNLDGRGPSWILESFVDDDFQTYEVHAHGAVEKREPIPEGPVAGNPPEYGACALAGDSPPIGAALAQTKAWRVLDIVNATPGPAGGPMRLLWEAECLADHTVWSLHSSLVENVEGTWSSRAFWLDQDGRLAGFFGDSGLGHPMSASSTTQKGMNIESTQAFSGNTLFGEPQATFETGNAVQLVIVTDVQYQGISHPLAQGTLVAIGPSGEAYSAPWAHDGPQALYIPEASPSDAQGTWTVQVDLGSDLPAPFSTRFEICSGVVFMHPEPSCQALRDFQNGT